MTTGVVFTRCLVYMRVSIFSLLKSPYYALSFVFFPLCYTAFWACKTPAKSLGPNVKQHHLQLGDWLSCPPHCLLLYEYVQANVLSKVKSISLFLGARANTSLHLLPLTEEKSEEKWCFSNEQCEKTNVLERWSMSACFRRHLKQKYELENEHNMASVTQTSPSFLSRNECLILAGAQAWFDALKIFW